MPRAVPPAHRAGPSRTRNGLGAVTFVVVLLGALLAVFPATAALGFLLCLLALGPAFVAYRRTRKGTATNPGRSFAAVVMAPVFLVVAVVVGAGAAPPQVETASDTSVLAAAPVVVPPAPAPLLAVPAPVPAVTVPAAPTSAVVPSTVHAASSASSSSASSHSVSPTSVRTATRAPALRSAPADHAAVAPAPVVKKAAPPPPKVASTSLVPPAPPAKPKPVTETAQATASATCDEHTSYVNSSGHCVHRPSSTGGGSPTFRCNDGTFSYSEHRQGTCSGHGGIAEQL